MPSLLREYKCTFMNDLQPGLDLTIHCRSGDDNLGIQVLRHHESMHFHFRNNIFDTTFFYCGFRWKDAFHRFEIYDELRDDDHCTECSWKLRKDGPCLILNEGIKFIC